MARTRGDLIRDRFGVSIGVNLDALVAAVAATPTQLLKNDPNRLSLTIVNTSAVIMYVWPNNMVAAAKGIALAAGGGTMNLVWDEDFDSVGLEWWAIAAGGGATFAMIEVVAR